MKILLVAIILMATSTPFVEVKSEEILNSTIAPIGVLVGVLLFIFGFVRLMRGNSPSSNRGNSNRFVSGGHMDSNHSGFGD